MYFILSFYILMSSLLSFLFSLIFISTNTKIMISWTMIKILSWKIEFLMFIDWMTLIFISTVMLISSMVLIYSMEYMKNHYKFNHFMKLIIIFFLSMMMMIISPNMLSILLGWDGLGLSSYCLIIFYQNKKSNISGLTTILMNRIGDISILLLTSILMNKCSLNIMLLTKIDTLMMILIMITAITKSAQIPFSVWLPLAMAAPTPVSSLVHSSTLVTAGVYLLIRFIYILPINFMYILTLISTWTMIMASTSAVFEFDMKKIIALSTLSQLSLMFLTISFNLPSLAFFHLISHAMFKSLLFLCSGIIIHNYFNHQDIRFISLTNLSLPVTNLMFSVASLSLCGLPFLSGFYSKDSIIEMFNLANMNIIIFYIMYLSMTLTVLYSFRLIFYIVMKPLKMKTCNTSNIHNLMNLSIYILFFMSILYGSTMNWIMFNSVNMIFLPTIKMTLIFMLSLSSLMMIYGMMVKKMNLIKMSTFIFFNKMWLMQSLMKKSSMNIIKTSNYLTMIKDLGWIEYLSSKKMFYWIMKINHMKKIFKLKFSIILIAVSYFTFISYIMM
uniref:NADH-ubiquinone oxidoreductase chain 5 n=1 Tax=Elasmosoma sp. QL-2014 TaxID=1491720 RepID=A0A0U1WY94_9HYME|nr:NADH dehydrogenase subunit 5 [Elasmosoma sp. QL-2014]